MPSKEQIKRNTVTENMLTPHLRNRLMSEGGGATIINDFETSVNIGRLFTLGEAVAQYQPVSLNSSGLIVGSSIIVNDERPMIGVALSSGVVGEPIRVAITDAIEIPISANNLEISRKVYQSNMAPYFTSNPSMETGTYFQECGIAIEQDVFTFKLGLRAKNC